MSYAYWDQISIVLAAILRIESPYWSAPSQIASSRNCGYALRSRILKPEPWAPNLGPHPILSGPTNSAMSHKSDFMNQESGCNLRNESISQIRCLPQIGEHATWPRPSESGREHRASWALNHESGIRNHGPRGPEWELRSILPTDEFAKRMRSWIQVYY